MGKHHRHQKNLKAEKGKVKLKQTKTKFLPKGLNVTNPTFKIKPIVLQEQLKERVSDIPLSKRRLDINDLLTRLKHYNENVRHKACEEMAVMVKFHAEEIINHHLSVIILSISTLMQDKLRKVRRGAIKVVNSLLEVVPDEKLEPFYHYFLINLRCAMTNIDKDIQEDSLLFLDCFLLFNSKIISRNPEKLLPDFFTLISKLRSESKLERTLTVNLGSKMTSVTWRIKVLSRLHAVLQKILGVEVESTFENDEMNQVFDAETSQHFPLFKCKLFENLSNNTNWRYTNVSSVECSTDQIQKNMATIVPLLYETWIEVMPDKKSTKSSNDDTVLNDEAAAILACVMNTLYLLWKYIMKQKDAELIRKIFLTPEGKKFFDCLVAHFPYKQLDNNIKKAKISNEMKVLQVNLDNKCSKENLLICLLYSALTINISQRTNVKQMESITGFVLEFLLGRSIITTNNMNYLLEFLEMGLLKHNQVWRKCQVDLRQLLDGTIYFYNITDEKNGLRIFQLLVDLADFPIAQKSEQYSLWLKTLPKLLIQPTISDIQVSCLLNISKRGSVIFHESLNRLLPKIIENLNRITIHVLYPNILNNEDIVQQKIAYMFFYLPKLGKIKSRFVLEYIAKHPECKFGVYLRQMLDLRRDFGK